MSAMRKVIGSLFRRQWFKKDRGAQICTILSLVSSTRATHGDGVRVLSCVIVIAQSYATSFKVSNFLERSSLFAFLSQ